MVSTNEKLSECLAAIKEEGVALRNEVNTFKEELMLDDMSYKDAYVTYRASSVIMADYDEYLGAAHVNVANVSEFNEVFEEHYVSDFARVYAAYINDTDKEIELYETVKKCLEYRRHGIEQIISREDRIEELQLEIKWLGEEYGVQIVEKVGECAKKVTSSFSKGKAKVKELIKSFKEE